MPVLHQRTLHPLSHTFTLRYAPIPFQLEAERGVQDHLRPIRRLYAASPPSAALPGGAVPFAGTGRPAGTHRLTCNIGELSADVLPDDVPRSPVLLLTGLRSVQLLQLLLWVFIFQQAQDRGPLLHRLWMTYISAAKPVAASGLYPLQEIIVNC